MDKQTQQAFALGGLNDEGGEIDKASGNRVPIGGTKEGVRDDIEINISEGEFVFPADVVRYHGLDKMMALRQEAKMGLKQMERMGQMGNSEEATMPDDLPFDMADLIVVGGKGEPMEFAEGGFVPSYTPKFETLETADVPMMDKQSSISYEGFTSPKVTMKEFRNEQGESIIITYINGVATISIPEGYTLYIPPEDDVADDGTPSNPIQKAINTVNINYDDGPSDPVEQAAPNYRIMNNDEFFAYMTDQNSFGAKAGQAAATAIGFMIPIPGVGLLTQVAISNHKNNLMDNMKSRIDRMPLGPDKTKALAAYKEYGGEVDPKKKQGLLNSITNFVTGLVTPVANALGINKQDAAKVAQNAAVTEVSGAAAYDEKVKQARANIISPAQTVTPTADQTRPQLRPDNLMPTVRQMVEGAPKGNVVPDQIASPLGNVLSAEADQGMVPAPASTSVAARSPTDFQYDAQNKALISGRIADQNFTNDRNAFIKANNQAKQIEQNAEQMRADAARERSLTMPGGSDQSVSRSKIKAGKSVGAAPSPDDFEELSAGPQTDYGRRIANARGDSFIGGDFQTAGILGDTIGAINRYGAKNLGGIDPNLSEDSVINQVRQGVTTITPSFTQAPVAPSQPSLAPMATSPSFNTQQRAVGEDFDAVPQEADPRDARVNQQFGNDNYIDPNVVPSNQQSLYTGASGEGYGIGQVDPRLAAAVQTQQALGITTAGTGGYDQLPSMGSTMGPLDRRRGVAPVTSMSGIEPYNTSVEPKERSMYEYPVQETAAQARAREAQTQRARIQTRNKEIAAATALIPDRIKNSSYYNNQVKGGYTGSTTGGYAVGKISGSDGDPSGVVQKADGKVQKVRDVQGYENLKGTQRGAMTVFKDSKGNAYVKSLFGNKTNLDGSEYTGPGDAQGGSTDKSGSTGSGRSRADIQADINKAVNAAGKDAQGNQNWTPELNDLVAERDGSKSSDDSSSSSSSNKQSGTGFFRGADEEGNTGSDSTKGGYSCYVATALSEKGYWSHTQKIKLIKWCMEAKPEGKLDTTLWRNGYCIFGKNIIAPKVDNKIIQWLSNGFYHATINNKRTLQAILGRLFFIIPSYTIGIWKALRGSLVDIERT